MREWAQEDDDGDALGDIGDDAQEELLDTRKRSLFHRISRQRAAYFADIQDGEGSEEDLVDSIYTKGAGGFMGRVGAPGGGQKPAHQSSQVSGFADVSTWCCDALAPALPSAPVPACSQQLAQDEPRSTAIADQPTLLMPTLAPEPGPIDIADMPTEPLLVVISRGKARGGKKPGVLTRLCPGFLKAWLRRLKSGPRPRQKPATHVEKHAKQIVAKEKKKQAAASRKTQQQVTSGKEQQPAAVLKQAKQLQVTGEQAASVENAEVKEKGKAEKKAKQEEKADNHRKRVRSDKGSQILLERLREREQRGDMPRTLTPPVLRPARIHRPPTDNLFGK